MRNHTKNQIQMPQLRQPEKEEQYEYFICSK